MTTQAQLWRTADPSSSATAAIELTTSGHRARQKDRILAALEAHPGATASELGEYCGLTNVQVCRRLPDLEADGLASPTGEMRRGLLRTSEQVWAAN